MAPPWPAPEAAILGGANIARCYSGLEPEYRAIREAAAVIDHAGIGCLRIAGDGATDLLQRAAARDVAYMFPERCLTTLLLDQAGRVVDLVVIYRLDEGYLVETSFGRVAATIAHLRELAPEVEISDVSTDVIVLGVEGPDAVQVATDVIDEVVASLPFQGVSRVNWQGAEVMVSRTGFTGEYGYKLFLDTDQAASAADVLLPQATPVGMDALEVAMLEVRQPILHKELGDDGDTVRCGLNWLVELAKPDFLGRDALLAQRHGSPRMTVGFEQSAASEPVDGNPIVLDGTVIGEAVFSLYSPGRDARIGLARFEPGWAASGLEVEAETRSGRVPLRTISSPYIVPKSWGGPVL